jgi:hypothetical protein
MPLAFDSLSHGSIAFGFFNIESDMLLCDRYFLFADDFCEKLKDIAEWGEERSYQAQWPVQIIESAADIGDLMGAIHGVRFSGFLGDLYRRFPFPQNPADFKQNPRGYETQSQVSEIIAAYARVLEIVVAMPPGDREIKIGEYEFSRTQFQELVKYVWRGGYPRWKSEIRPAYVMALKEKILKNSKGIFKGLVFKD